MTEKEMLAELKADFGKQTLLSAKDIAPYLGKTDRAVTSMRVTGTLPLPVHKVGGNYFVTIHDLAKFLVDPSAFNPKPDEITVAINQKPQSKKPVNNPLANRDPALKRVRNISTKDILIRAGMILGFIKAQLPFATEEAKKERELLVVLESTESDFVAAQIGLSIKDYTTQLKARKEKVESNEASIEFNQQLIAELEAIILTEEIG